MSEAAAPPLPSSTATAVVTSGPAIPEESLFYGVRKIDPRGTVVQEWYADSLEMFRSLQVDESEETLLVYSAGSDLPEILQADGSRIIFAEPQWSEDKPSFGNDYGFDVLYADRLLNNEIYAVKGNRTLYVVNIKTGKTRKLYTSDLPINGIAASPDNSRVALLVVSNEYLTPEEDLVVLDRQGHEEYRKPQASYSSHSDGFLFVYSMAWTNDHNVAVPILGNENYGKDGVKEFNVDEDTVVAHENMALSQDALQLLELYAGTIQYPNTLCILPEPGDNPHRYAVEISSSRYNNLWLLDTAAKQATKLETGHLLKWTNDGNLLMGVTKPENPFYLLELPALLPEPGL
jgi:hypothetical protein